MKGKKMMIQERAERIAGELSLSERGRENRMDGTIWKLTSVNSLECLFIASRRQWCPHKLSCSYLDKCGWSSWNFFSDCLHFLVKRENVLSADNKDRKTCRKCEEKGENKGICSKQSTKKINCDQ